MISLMAVGDIMLGRLVGEKARQTGGLYPFEYVVDLLGRGDIVFGNLECPFSTDGVPNNTKPSELLLRADPEMGYRLSKAGFSIVSLANNHIFDYGAEAFQDTIRILRERGIHYVGAGLNEREARTPVVLNVKGLKVGFIAYTYAYPARGTNPGCAYADPHAIRNDIEVLRAKADVLVVSLHDGIEFTDYPLPRIHKLAHRMIDWGAHLILGHHPHTLQGIEEYKDGLIAYSLGDFVFDNADEDIRKAAYARTAVSLIRKPLELEDLRPLESIILECRLSEHGVEGYRPIPICIGSDFQPKSAEEDTTILARLEELSKPLRDEHDPVWKDMEDLEHQVKALSLSKLSITDILLKIRRPRVHHLRSVPVYLGYKLRGWIARRLG